jgi:uncharacterized Zn finger protein (UPF0148 family)
MGENKKINKQITKIAKDRDLKIKKVKLGFSQKAVLDMNDLMLNPASIIHCDECKERLGIFHTLRYALFKKQGTVYHVLCKNCSHLNTRVKGQYKTDTNQKWKTLQDELDKIKKK